jgi:uncharacterized protein (DUF302 family)
MKIFSAFLFFFISTISVFSQNNNGVKSMFLENESKYNFSETVEKLSSEITEFGWKVTMVHDLQETLKKNGKEVKSIKVVETCNPNFAYRILSLDDQRIYSNMLPCRISIYEKSDGKTYISRMNAEIFAKQLDGVVAEVMTEAFHSVEKIISNVVK